MKSVLGAASCTATILAFGIAAYAQTTGQTSGQPAGQPSSQQTTQAQTDTDRSGQQQATLVGCVQREADYRRAHGAGQGGAVGTGVGVGNEFVLINASLSTASGATGSGSPTGTTATGSTTGTTSGTSTGSTTGTTGSTTGTATGTTTGSAPSAPGTAAGMPSTAGSPSATAGVSGTTGTTTAMNAYELTGPGEGQLQQHVGRRVEITGRLKPASPGKAGVDVGGSKESGSATGSVTVKKGSVDPLGQDLNLREFEVVSVREAPGSCDMPERR